MATTVSIEFLEANSEQGMTNEEKISALGRWLVNFGNHLIAHPELVDRALITCYPVHDNFVEQVATIGSSISYENDCKIDISVTKRIG